MKRPAFQFYPGDWLRDSVACCSIAAQGLWLRMMIVMHDREPYGHLAVGGNPMPPAAVAQACGVTVGQYRKLLAELEAAGVPRKTDGGVIYSKRMVDDHERLERERIRKQTVRDLSADCPADVRDLSAGKEDEDRRQKNSGIRGGAGGEHENGSPWDIPPRRHGPQHRKPNPEAVDLLRGFGLSALNSAKWGSHENATTERVRWLIEAAKRRLESGSMGPDYAVAFVCAGIRDGLDEDPGPKAASPEEQIAAVKAARQASIEASKRRTA